MKLTAALAALAGAHHLLKKARGHRDHGEHCLAAASLLYMEAVQEGTYVHRLATAILADDLERARDLIAMHQEHNET